MHTLFGDIYFSPKSSFTQIIVSSSLLSVLLLKLYANYRACIHRHSCGEGEKSESYYP